jgi:hypothetical protein
MDRCDKEQYICTNVDGLSQSQRQTILYKIINVYNLGSMVSVINSSSSGSTMDLSKVKDERLIDDLFEFVKLKISSN